MPVFHWQTVLLSFAMSIALGGCNGNYTFNDHEYRPLGDPEAINRAS